MLENLTPPTRSVLLKVEQTRKTLTPEDQKLFDSYLADCETWSPNSLSVALRRQNIMLSGDTIRRHRVRNNLC